MDEQLVSDLFSTTDPTLHLGISSGRWEQALQWSQTSKPTLFIFVFLECHLNKDVRNEFQTFYLTEGGIIIPVGRAAAFLVGPFWALHIRVVAVVRTVIAGRGVMLENRKKSWDFWGNHLLFINIMSTKVINLHCASYPKNSQIPLVQLPRPGLNFEHSRPV